MVVAILVNQFAPSSRGLERRSVVGSDGVPWPESGYHQFDHRSTDVSLSPKSSAQRRKPFKAISVLTSVASDIDLIVDWLFFADAASQERDYRDAYKAGHAEGDLPYLVPPVLLYMAFWSCVMGSVMWLVLATDGRTIAPFMRWMGYDKISMGYMLLLSVIVEDVPQVILTFMIEGYFEDEDSLSNVAICNLMASLYDMLIKLAESYDERYDVVETGDWLKQSVWAHRDIVTSVLTIQDPSTCKTAMASKDQRQSGLLGQDRPNLLDDAPSPMAPAQIPRLRFITTSCDRRIRLWDTDTSKLGQRRGKCIRTFRGHAHAVTCVAYLGDQHRQDNQNDGEYKDESIFFVTGCKDGCAKMWNLRGDFIQTYHLPTNKENAVVCLTTLDAGSTFVAGHDDGTAKLWGSWSGVCIGLYHGHSATITSMCSMRDGLSFITGSKDGMIKVWDSTGAMVALQKGGSLGNEGTQGPSTYEESICKQSFGDGLQNAVHSVVCMQRGNMFCSGSEDCLARLWSLESGLCLHVFAGHVGPVRAMAIIDDITLLTGSDDTNIMAWDIPSGAWLRTYSNHTRAVTCISATNDNRTFASSSADQTVKIWVLTSVLPVAKSEFDPIHEVSGGMCYS